MYKLAISCLILFFSSGISADEFKNKKVYVYGDDDHQIEIIGTKKAIKNYPFLFLKEPIEVNPKTPEDNADGLEEPEKNVKILQIAQHFHKKIPNGCVILKGFLYHADNANHKTNVLFSTDSYRLCKDVKQDKK